MAYGIYVGHCPECKWTTLKKIQPDPHKTTCKACGKAVDSWEFSEDVACWICTVSEKKSEKLWEHARSHGLIVYQTSPKRYTVLETRNVSTVGYKDGQARAFPSARSVLVSADYQTCMKYIREHTPDLPGYLKD